MDNYQDSELGLIPSDWQFIKSSKYCVKVTDGTHDSPKQKLNGNFLITSKHIKGRNIDFENAYLISEDDYNKINQRSKVDQWDVIISMIGEYCGFAYLERNKNINYAVKNVGIFKTGDELKGFWLYYYIQSNFGKTLLDGSKSGTSQPYISLGSLREFPILTPNSRAEQQAIISVFSSLDDKIDLLHRLKYNLEAMANALFRHWFVEEAKEDWEETTLYDSISLIGGGTPKTSDPEYWNGNIPWLSGGDIASNHKNFIVKSEKSITQYGLENSSAQMLPKYSTVISARGTVGKYCILSKPMAFSQSNYGIKPKFQNCFFFTYLLINHSVEELQSAAYGSVFDTITTSTFKEHKLSLPDEKEIHSFEAKVTPIFLKLLCNNNQINPHISKEHIAAEVDEWGG